MNMKIWFYPETCYRLSFFPIVGEEANELVDDNEFDNEVFERLDDINVEEFEREYDVFFDFYSSEDGIECAVGDEDPEEMEDNALFIDESKYDLEEMGREPDDDFLLIANMEEPGGLDEESKEIFKDIKNRQNDATEEEHVGIIFDAVCRRLKQVAERLVENGAAEDAESVRFAMQFGQVYGACYSFDFDTAEFDPGLLRTIDCTDWNDCGDCETLYSYWPDRLLGNVVYDGKFYAGQCEQIDSFDYKIDLVNFNMESQL